MGDRCPPAVLAALQLRAMLAATFQPETVLTGTKPRLHQERALMLPPAAGGLAVVVADPGNGDRGGFDGHGCISPLGSGRALKGSECV